MAHYQATVASRRPAEAASSLRALTAVPAPGTS